MPNLDQVRESKRTLFLHACSPSNHAVRNNSHG